MLMGKFGARAQQAAARTAAAEPEFDSFGDLPAGIVGAVAQLVDCRILPIAEGKKNAGELMFFARAIVKSPAEHDGVMIKGLGTSIMQNLIDDKDANGNPIEGRQMEDKLVLVQEHVKKIANVQPGVPFDPTPFYAENLEATCTHLKEMSITPVENGGKPIHIRFRTWKGTESNIEQGAGGKWFVYEGSFDRSGNFKSAGKLAVPFANGQRGVHPPGGYPTQAAAAAVFKYAGKPSMTNHVWSGVVDWHGDAPAGAGVVDSTPKANGTSPAAPREKAQFRTAAPAKAPPDPPVPPQVDNGSDGTDTVDDPTSADGDLLSPELADLLNRAKAKEDGGLEEAEAQTQLLETAIALGVDQETIDGPSWDDLVAAIAAKQAEGGEGVEPTAEEPPVEDGPQVGNLYFVHWPLTAQGKATVNPKTKKPVKLEVEIATVDAASRVVTVKDLNTGKPVLASNKKPRLFGYDDLLDGR